MSEMTPKETVAKLDEHIIGQDDAKRAVAIALRNRWRWSRLSEELRGEITPKNIIMIGPTGVGKTEITRRLAVLTGAPFIKVEATKYTEVGYYGRDVESMVRDLVESAIQIVRAKKRGEVEEQARQRAEERLVDLLIPAPERRSRMDPAEDFEAKHTRVREKFRDMLATGQLEDRKVELKVDQRHVPVQILSNMGMEQMDVDFQNMFEKIMPKQQSKRELSVADARKVLFEQEVEALLDKGVIHEQAIHLAEDQGIIFIDEMDKICGSEGSKNADVSRQGVQRDLLPIVEGTTVQTRYGSVKTDKVLFIAAGAFHSTRPSDLMPELQGRFPIRVELKDLTRDDFLRILTEPTGSLTRQYIALLETDGVSVDFTPDGLEAIADIAWQVNQSTQNIGARRLHTILERLLEDVSYHAPDMQGATVKVDSAYVHERLDKVTQQEDLAKFIL